MFAKKLSYCIVKYNDFDANRSVFVRKWVHKNVIHYVKAREKSVRKPGKVSLEFSLKELLKEFNIPLKTSLVHIRKIAHQYEATKEIKSNLSQTLSYYI